MPGSAKPIILPRSRCGPFDIIGRAPAGRLRLLGPPSFFIHETRCAIAVVMPHPVGQIAPGAGLIAALRGEIEIHVGPENFLGAAPESRVGMKDGAAVVLMEHAVSG